MLVFNFNKLKLKSGSIKKPLNYWRVAGVIRREHMMRY
jgi:hypothetical protein